MRSYLLAEKFREMVLGVSALILILVNANLNWSKKSVNSIVEADAKGYYAWLPAVFIYGDLHFGFFETVESHYVSPETYYDYRLEFAGEAINKYPAGTALLELPFFGIAHLLSHLSGEPADGYSFWYPVMISVAGLFYVLAGLWMLTLFLKGKGYAEWSIAVTIVVLLFGTNLFYYAVVEPGMSHVYSFALATGWLRGLQLLGRTGRQKYLYAAAVIGGLVVLVRPMNLLLLLSFPLALDNRQQLKNSFSWQHWPIAILTFTVLVMLQPILWFLQTGNLFIDTYPGEHFSTIHLYDFLFSFKKGAFLYTPVLLVALFGLKSIYRQSKFNFWFILIYLTTIFTILSSWGNWWYGGSFSSRVLVEYLPIFALPLVSFIAEKKGRQVRLLILTLLILFCQFQTYQYRYYIIHWEDMNRELYFNSLFRLP